MSSLSSILAPMAESPEILRVVEEEGDGERMQKRRRSTPQGSQRSTLTPERIERSSKDDIKAKWLAGLSHDELLGVAQGGVWQGMSLVPPNAPCVLNFNCPE